ncbi:IgGFc-binding protein-like [Saccostrea cucullata]|uniref:IgGFc-binding protein-like n=1 Tax=Saccostrea cuccullata TaxID=36930 RepID=UPI002ECFBB16
MERSNFIWKWIFLFLMHFTQSYAEKPSVTEMYSRREELNLLKSVLKRFSALEELEKENINKMESIERKLNIISEKISDCVGGISVHPSIPTSQTTRKSPNTTVKIKSAHTTRTQSATTETTSTKPTSSITQLPRSIGSRGREFLILFMKNHPAAKGSPTIYITTGGNASVNISTSNDLNASTKLATDIILNVSYYSNITLPYDLSCDYLSIESKAVLLQTSELSTVSIFDSFHKSSNDGTLIISTNRLSTRYLVSSTNPYKKSEGYYSQFAVAALYKDTNVNITFKMKTSTSISLLGGTYEDQDVLTTTLNKYETLQIMHTSDLTGTFIESTKRIAVFSGNRCQQMKVLACSHMVSQLPPTTELDNRYIIPAFYGNLGTLIQVISESQNSIKISEGRNSSTLHMNEKEFMNIEVTSGETTTVESDNPVLVTGFAMGSSNKDPYMTVIPGVNQYVDYYNVVVPDGYAKNYICVIIQQKYTDDLKINDTSTDHYKSVQQSSAAFETTYSIRIFEVDSGPIVISTTNNSTFGLIVYGHRMDDGYAFTGNYVLS